MYRKRVRVGVFFLLAVFLVTLIGCGVSKKEYNALLEEKTSLEGKSKLLSTLNSDLRDEVKGLRKEKATLAESLKTAVSEKDALKVQYDKLLNEVTTLTTTVDKLTAENKALKDL